MTDDNEYFDTGRFEVKDVELEIENELEQVRGNGPHVNDIEWELTIPRGGNSYWDNVFEKDKRTFTINDVLEAADHLETDELATLIDNLYGDKSGENLET